MQMSFQSIPTSRPESFYLLPIGGTAMATLAGLLQATGHQVQGVDVALYPPMSTLLEELNIPVRMGWDPSRIPSVDRIIIGNAVGRSNPEVQQVLESRRSFLSQSEAVAHYLLSGGRRAIVVAGSHGKTTTSSLLAWVFESAGVDPTAFVGGLLRWNRRSFLCGRGEWMILEGDEYNAAFFDRGPKFLHYRPEIFVLGPVEFDHADLYPNLDAVLTAFRAGTAQVPRHGRIVASWDFPGTRSALRDATAEILRVGRGQECELHLLESVWDPEAILMRSRLRWQGRDYEMTTPLAGKFNADNAAMALGAGLAAGLEMETLLSGLATFPGVARRMDVLGEADGVLVVDDFAHHPTALGVTIRAARERWPSRRLVVAFEPRSLTAARRDFGPLYVEALQRADTALVARPYHADRVGPKELLDRESIRKELENAGTQALMPEEGENPVDVLLPHLRPGDLLLGCSSGDFGGFHQAILAKLKARSLV